MYICLLVTALNRQIKYPFKATQVKFKADEVNESD